MTLKNHLYDVVIIGAGAAGLMAAFASSSRGKRVLLLEHTGKIGEKIRISGGGRCNFTNINTHFDRFICKNPHFVKSALSAYSAHDFIKLVEDHGIAYHEKTLGQLFCDGSSKQIIQMLLNLCQNVDIKMSCSVQEISKPDNFEVTTTHGTFMSCALIIATGGLSIPQIGASDFGYRIAKQFGHKIIPTKPALVPLSVPERFTQMSGVSNHSIVGYKKVFFEENILFTHKGLSGPAILQISSYLESFKSQIVIDLLPQIDLEVLFLQDKNSKQTLSNYLKNFLPNRFVDHMETPDFGKTLTDLKKETLLKVAQSIHHFKVQIQGSEGYQKAEVTAGGVDTDEISSKTMESKNVKGLFFIGEVMDVTGWLGGYNFQWAWSSGIAAGKSV